MKINTIYLAMLEAELSGAPFTSLGAYFEVMQAARFNGASNIAGLLLA